MIKNTNKHGRIGVRGLRLTRANLKRQSYAKGFKEGRRVSAQDLIRYQESVKEQQKSVHDLLNNCLRTNAAARIHTLIRGHLEKRV